MHIAKTTDREESYRNQLLKHQTQMQEVLVTTFDHLPPHLGYNRTVAYLGGGRVQPPPEIPKILQNRAKLNPIVKTVNNADANTPGYMKKKAVKL